MFTLQVLTSFIVLIVHFTYSNGKQFRFDYEYQQEVGGWLKLHRIPTTWQEAFLTCHHEGSILASPENKTIQYAVLNAMRKEKLPFEGIFTGLYAHGKGHYATIEGTPLDKIPVTWAPGEPNNYRNNENCILMMANGTIADVNCDNVHPFVCYKKDSKSVVLNECGTIDNEYKLDSRTGSCYKFHTEPLTWYHALAACADEGGHLVIINNETEAKIIKELYEQHPDKAVPGKHVKDIVHIGFKDYSDHGLWLTIHGQTLDEAGYAIWRYSSPDNEGGQQYCGGVTRMGTLDDVTCTTSIPFICEKKPSSLLSAVPLLVNGF